ncbi:hypothetical protein [Bowmanella dokdonensis]|uniref:Uncharacterized protein n=1 Tax=Bowmanella dokdonensis TaxID=751969 RepID=A0A939DQK8_9ALTE|nr:hypothetical protein [Bowmanella dokdonensis]MBN7826405.1 hypothetical protein [Bowmanella dokdonensis]
MAHKQTGTPAEAGVLPVPPQVTAEMALWWQQARVLAYDQLQLLMLEGQRVANSMVALLIFALLAGLLALTFWFALLAQIIILAQHSLLSVAQALGLAMVVNLSGLWFVLRRLRSYSHLIGFPATMQSLRLSGTTDSKGAR